MTTAIDIKRSPDLIASEINMIKEQTRRFFLSSAIEIGRRLCEAKESVPHGEWGNWLETSVDYKQSTANNLMRIFTEYGNNQVALFGETGTKSQAIGKLSYTQAVALLAIPSEEREEFVEEHDVESMSTRELQRVIKERDEANQKLTEKTDEVKELRELRDKLDKEVDKGKAQIARLQTSVSDIQKQLKEAQATGDDAEVKRLQAEIKNQEDQLADSNKRIQELEQQIKDTPIDITGDTVAEKIPDEVQAELDELRAKKKSQAALEFKIHFDNLVKGFNSLLGSLGQIESEEQEKYKGAVRKLIDQMAGRL